MRTFNVKNNAFHTWCPQKTSNNTYIRHLVSLPADDTWRDIIRRHTADTVQLCATAIKHLNTKPYAQKKKKCIWKWVNENQTFIYYWSFLQRTLQDTYSMSIFILGKYELTICSTSTLYTRQLCMACRNSGGFSALFFHKRRSVQYIENCGIYCFWRTIVVWHRPFLLITFGNIYNWQFTART